MILSGDPTLKFKFLMIIFSILIVFVIVVVVLLPMMLAGSGSALEVNFRLITLPLLAFMVILLIGMGIFFFFNYRLLSLLEREDWPALAYYLEQKVFVKGKYSNRNVRLLASSYLVISDYNSVLKLENKVMLAKSAIIDKNLLLFGSARVLSGKHAEAAAFFSSHLEKDKFNSKDEHWVRWYYGFSLLLSGAFKLAQPEFAFLAVSSNDAVLAGLSAYFLSNSIKKHSENPDDCLAASESGRIRVINAVKNRAGWKKEAAKMGSDIHVAIIKKYIEETNQWLFSK